MQLETLLQLLKAFVVGGLICVIGQILIDKTKLTPARILVSFVVAGTILSALGLYQPLADFAVAGATVSLTGFGHLLIKGVKEGIAKDGLLGVLTGGLTSTAGGITASILCGVLVAIIFKPKNK